VRQLRELMAQRAGPLVANITVNAGAIPREHWTQDPATGGGRIVGECCHFIDLARHLTRSAISTIQVTSARNGSGNPIDDIALVQLAFDDGSTASIQYLANGNKGFPKERVELFWDDKVARIDNFRHLEGWGISVPMRWLRGQDKGHRDLAAAFMSAVRDPQANETPIPLAELLEVSRASIHAAELARRGGGSIAMER
jgi:predicted dehydrogenase